MGVWVAHTHPLPPALAWLCPCDCCPGTSAFPAPTAATPQVPALTAIAQPGGAVQLLPATGFPCLPRLGCCWVSLMPKPFF